MDVSLEYCPTNISAELSATNSSESAPFDLITESGEVSFLFRFSILWTSFFAILATVLLGILMSALTGEMYSEAEQPHLTSDIIKRTWRKCFRPHVRGDQKESAQDIPILKQADNQAENKTLLSHELYIQT